MELAQLDPAALVRALTIIEKCQRRKERAKEVAFTDNYASSKQVIIVKKSSHITSSKNL